MLRRVVCGMKFTQPRLFAIISSDTTRTWTHAGTIQQVPQRSNDYAISGELVIKLLPVEVVRVTSVS